MKLTILGSGDSNTKLAKSNRKSNYLTYGVSLAPSMRSGYQVCPHASPGCISSCIFTSGLGGVYRSIPAARIAKTKLWFESRQEFKNRLLTDIDKVQRNARKNRKRVAIRLNMFSDLSWERVFPQLFADFPTVQWYDYTKLHARMLRFLLGDFPPNYHLTFSRSELNRAECEDVLSRGGNVSAVFRDDKAPKTIPARHMGYPVFDGDQTDLRFTDPKSHVIGLYAKGSGIHDETGFVVRRTIGR
tara:strand:+ start:787 stop:1518 length:732 start_codon:yes stop_codon:yes gene_type:complete